jgi:hypothetical protein
MENDEPMRPKLRKLQLVPIWQKSKTLAHDPNLAQERSERVEPNVIVSSTE